MLSTDESTTKTMKRTFKALALILALIMMLGIMCACSNATTAALMLASNDGEQDSDDIIGEWIDLEDDTMIFNKDGSCVVYDNECESYSFDGEKLEVVCEGETLSIDARLFGEYFVTFYEPYTYDRVSGNSGELEGEWESNEGYDYSFKFEDGKFTEDGAETGTYAVDGEEIMFIYDDTTDGAYLFSLYRVDGDELYFYYGWALCQE